jgi:hypothetical protein
MWPLSFFVFVIYGAKSLDNLIKSYHLSELYLLKITIRRRKLQLQKMAATGLTTWKVLLLSSGDFEPTKRCRGQPAP